MRCYLTIPFKDGKSVASVLGAIQPEQAGIPSGRAQVQVTSKCKKIVLEIRSRDVTSMRAAVNSYLRWLILAKKVTELAGDD